jgi:hypothetical protein
MKTLKVLFPFILIVMLVSCGGGGGSSSGGGGTDSTVNVSGTWKGTGNSPQTGTLPTTLILVQSGNNVSGTWDSLAVTGTVSSNQLALTFTPFTLNGVNITGSGLATVTGNSMSGTISMKGTTTVSATFTATRSNAKTVINPSQDLVGGLLGAAVGNIAN